MLFGLPIWALGLLGAGAVGVVAAAGSGENSQTMREIKATRAATFVGVQAASKKKPRPPGWPKHLPWPPKGEPTATKLPTGPLPKQATDAYNRGKSGKGRKRSAYGGANDLKKRGKWFRFATYSDKWDTKLDHLRYYGDPPGAIFVTKKGTAARAGNLAWMCRCKSSEYPGAGKAAYKNVRTKSINPWVGRGSDWEALGNFFKTSIKNIPSVIKGAGVVVAGIFSGGKSLQDSPEDQIGTVSAAIKDALEPLGDVGGSVSKRRDAARVVVTEIRKAYLRVMMDANPWAVKNGKLDISASYMEDPKTWEDLGKPGNARPLLFNPPST